VWFIYLFYSEKLYLSDFEQQPLRALRLLPVTAPVMLVSLSWRFSFTHFVN